jgi:hypothetical protein
MTLPDQAFDTIGRLSKRIATLTQAFEDGLIASEINAKSLKAENARLRAALEFYANKNNYKMRREPSYRDRFSQNMKPGKSKLGRVSEDKGKRARAALNALEKP